MSFYRRKSQLKFDYQLDNVAINLVINIRDLGILFDENMSFSSHIDLIVLKVYSMLGFMMRICSKFYGP